MVYFVFLSPFGFEYVSTFNISLHSAHPHSRLGFQLHPKTHLRATRKDYCTR